MPEYNAPIRDMKFVMQELLDCDSHYQKLGYEDASLDMVDAIISEAAKFTEQVIAPINQSGDAQGCTWNDGVVTTPDGFKEAYQQYVEGGWPGRPTVDSRRFCFWFQSQGDHICRADLQSVAGC